ncbi:putative c-C chemokine receptor type 8-like [Scophthalmus maximus]|uniref:Putative c-C chemokine receptor type 8-like n=1 Tax=Scophthalmus maximus TaxID=52904 RepID=A0A2U9BMG1_SCOMX|nr:putative c-C chemokine receptor type 8-like [Scophthalmus maximus]
MENLNCTGAIHQNITEGRYDRIIWCILPTVIIVPPLALPANALVIRLLLGKPGICCTSEIFTLQLAVFDMLFCLMILTEYIRFLCFQTLETSNFVAWSLNQAGGPLLLCFVGLDCYVGVCHPLVFLRLKDPKLRLSVCFVVNAVTAVSCYLIKFNKIFKWTAVSIVLIFTLVVISTCNILILKSLRQAGPSGKEVHPVKKRAFKIVLTSFVLVNIHYLPSVLEFLLKTLLPCLFSPFSAFTSVTFTVLSLSSVVQPLCYLARTKQLQKIRCQRSSAAETKATATV